MARTDFVRRHAKLFSFFGVLLVTSSLLVLMVGEARAVSVGFVAPPANVGTAGVFAVDVIIPNGQRIPITSIDAIIERQFAGAVDKINAQALTRTRCNMSGIADTSCPTTAPLSVVSGTAGLVTSIRYVGAFTQTAGTAVTNGYFGYGALTGTKTGYGYDTVSPVFQARGYGYGYGYTTGQVGAYADGNGNGYGYVGDGLRLRFEVTVAGAALTAGTHYLTVIINTGSGVLGEFSSRFTEFQASGLVGGGGGGGGGGGAGGAGGAASVSTTISGSTATATITGIAGNTATIDLSGLNSVLGTLTLTLATALTNAVVTVTTSTTPTEGALAIPTGFDSFLYLSINAPAGSVSGGALTFTLTNAQLGTNTAQSVVLMHFVSGAWVSLPTTPSTTGPQGATFTATMPSFSPFAIAFDRAPPTVSNVRPPEGSSATTRPVIAASIADNRGINTALTRMFIDGQVVTAVVTANEINYAPPVALTIGQHTVRVEATDLSGFSANRSWTFNAAQAADPTAPTVSPKNPLADGFTNNNRPLIEATYADNLGIDTTRVTATLDGAPVTAPAVTATGVSFTPAVALTDGRHTVTVTVSDTSGNSNFATWGFTVDTALPNFGAVDPADGATSGAKPTIRAQYNDALAGVDTAKVIMTLDSQVVSAAAQAGEVAFTPPADLPAGKHTVKVDITDKAGNTASKSWTFTSSAGAGGFDWTIIILVLVLLVIVGGAGYWYMKNKK